MEHTIHSTHPVGRLARSGATVARYQCRMCGVHAVGPPEMIWTEGCGNCGSFVLVAVREPAKRRLASVRVL